MRRNRRIFLKSAARSSIAATLAPGFPAFLRKTARAAAADNESERVLVVIQLAGGNDGLNTVVPYADDHYGRHRKTLRLDQSQVLSIDNYLGFHPKMAGFNRLFQEGYLSVIQGVGYPGLDRSHQPAMRVWQTGILDDPSAQTGWVGRAVDQLANSRGIRVPAIYSGQIDPPFALNSTYHHVPWINSFKVPFGNGFQDSEEARTEKSFQDPSSSSEKPLFDSIHQQLITSYASVDRIQAVLRESSGPVEYPQFAFAQQLRVIANLIRARLGTRIFYAELGGPPPGGFDNHAIQKENHSALLHQLSDSIDAFVKDLKHHRELERVILMTFSEFGRTLKENGRKGTGHGEAAPLFIIGKQNKAGLIGPHPDLSQLIDGAPPFHTDFRSVYSSILSQWLGINAAEILGDHFRTIDLF